MAMLSASSNLAFHYVHKFSNQSSIHSPTKYHWRRQQKSISISAAYTSTAPEREAPAIPLSSNLKIATSFYQVLGIPIGATNQEVKSAYRRLARIFHPDVAAMDRKSSSADEFMRIHSAYSTLSDPDKRSKYDNQLFKRYHRSGLYSAGSPVMSKYSGYGGRNWETDQCW